MKLKYQKEIDNFKCDLTSFKQRNRKAFHWVFPTITDEKNFIPVYVNSSSNSHTSCRGYALSFFNSKENARKRYLHLIEDRPLLSKRVGSHIAEGDLEKNDGISNNENKIGHFDHFEFENIELNSKFKIVEEILS